MRVYFESFVDGAVGRGLLGGGAGGRSTILDLSGLIAASPTGCPVGGIGFFAIALTLLFATAVAAVVRRHRMGADCWPGAAAAEQ